MVRLGPEGTDEALARPHTHLFDMTGRPMRGWILVALEGVRTKRQLAPGYDAASSSRGPCRRNDDDACPSRGPMLH